MQKRPLSLKEILAYSAVAFGLAIMVDPMPAILFQFFVLHTEISLAAVGTILLFSRILDAITDPLIGYYSDNTRSRLGSRKPWIIVGGIFSVFGVYFFFNPSPDSGVLYFAIFCNIYYLCRTLISIPHAAWGSEISKDYNERARIGAWFGGLLLIAQMLFMLVPIIVSSPFLPIFDSADLGPEMISLIGMVGIFFIPFSIILAVWLAPIGDDGGIDSGGTKKTSLLQNVRATAHNKPFWLLLTAKSIGTVGGLIFFSVAIIAMDNYLGLGEQVPIIMLSLGLIQIVTIPIWRFVAVKIGKHECIIAGWIIQAISLPMIFFIEPGPSAFIPFMVLASITASGQSPGIIFSNAILSDVVDYDVLKTGINRAGNYFSLDAFVLKTVGALAGSIGFWLLAIVRYDPKVSENTESAEFGLLLTLTILPSVLMFVAAIILFFYPINAKRHAIIKRRLETRNSRTQ